MTTPYPSLRPGLTAIAAVLALSATPVFAQAVDQSASAPVIAPAAPAAPDVTTATPTAAPVATPMTIAPPAADTTANMSAPVEPAAPVATQSPVVIHTTPASQAASDQANNPAPVTRSARTASVAPKTASTSVASTAPVAPVAAPAPAPAVQQAAPAEPAPIAAATPAPQAQPAPVAKTFDNREIELAAGAGVLGLLLIGGGAFALGRRRRTEEEPVLWETTEPVAEPVVDHEATIAPAYVAPAAPLATTPALAEANVPEGFDMSRMGPHTRAAYAGPSAENPSHSLRRRLKRAYFYDQRLRESGQEIETIPTAVAARQQDRSQTIVGTRLSDRLNFRPARKGSVSFKPATA
jgi:hypothetical protein